MDQRRDALGSARHPQVRSGLQSDRGGHREQNRNARQKFLCESKVIRTLLTQLFLQDGRGLRSELK